MVSDPFRRLADTFGVAPLPYALFYAFPHALRFELGGEIFCSDTEAVFRFLQAFDRARAVNRELFTTSQSVSALISYVAGARSAGQARKVRQQVKALGIGHDLGQPSRIASDEEGFELDGGTFRYCHCIDLPPRSYVIDALLWGAVSREMAIEPRLRGARLYLVDFDRGILLHAYDDRGMDVIATSPDPLLPLYETFADWLLDYDRPAMDATFSRR